MEIKEKAIMQHLWNKYKEIINQCADLADDADLTPEQLNCLHDIISDTKETVQIRERLFECGIKL